MAKTMEEAVAESREMLTQISEIMSDILPEATDLAEQINNFLVSGEHTEVRISALCAAFGILAGMHCESLKDIKFSTSMFYASAKLGCSTKDEIEETTH